jgi:hypothetical protein
LSHVYLGDSRLFSLLWRCDLELAAQAKGSPCVHCGGRLDVGNYARKPRGGRGLLGPEYKLRLSFCCATDGCRSRLTPRSVRFLGRRFYLGAIVVLVSALRDGLTMGRVTQLKEMIGVGARTLRRWRSWWQDDFSKSRFWQSVRARFSPPLDAGQAPASLVERFGDGPEDLVRLLQFLSPITTRAGLAMDD